MVVGHDVSPVPVDRRRRLVNLDTIDPGFFGKSYFLGPRGSQYGKVYALLEVALAESNKAGIATFVMRGREYLVALKADGFVHKSRGSGPLLVVACAA